MTKQLPWLNLPHELFEKAVAFARKNVVMLIALVAAVITSIAVPVDAEYIGYFDFKTLTCLFCVLAVKNARMSVLALVYITFIGSMLIANDMALLTFLPLGYFVLSETGKEKYMAFTFIMQNIAANLGGMLTPFGNPQNLYLYTKFNIPNLEFMGIMAPPFLVSIALITVCCFIFVRPEPLSLGEEKVTLSPSRTAKPLSKSRVTLCLSARLIKSIRAYIPTLPPTGNASYSYPTE